MQVKLNGNGFFRVTSEFKEIGPSHPKPHTGVDLAMPEGTKLYSPSDGVIERVVDYGHTNIGKGVIIRTEEGDRLILGHLSDTSQVHPGQPVHTGDLIGLSGNTGHSTGPHLHIGLRDGTTNQFVNPDRFFNGTEVAQVPEVIHNTAHNIQSLSPTEIFQSALSHFAESLSQMGMNLIHIVTNQFNLYSLLDGFLHHVLWFF